MADKQAYPNFDEYQAHQPPRDLNRWMAAMRDLYSRMRAGNNREDAFNTVTGSWTKVEAREFSRWLHYYEEQSHMKYKTAQSRNSYIENANRPGYFMPFRVNVPDPIVKIQPDTDSMRSNDVIEKSKVSDEEKRRMIEIQRKKIIGRLHSARKLLTDDNGKMFAGENWGKLIDALNSLEKEFHTVNKHSVSSKLYEDLIIRSANKFARDGALLSSEFLVKMAQGLPGAALPADPTASVPQGGALGNNTPDILQEEKPGIEKVMDAFNGVLGDDDESDDSDSDDSDSDDSDSDDSDSDDSDSDDFEIDFPYDKEEIKKDLVVEAQMSLPTPPAPLLSKEPAAQPEAKNDLEIVETDLDKHKKDIDTVTAPKDFDSLIDAAFSSLKVSDVVNKLEQLSRIFKNREIARQLSVADMMMDKLGLSSFFPSLAEATKSALESNQYCLTRIEEVKNKLSGAMGSDGKSVHDMGATHSLHNRPKSETDLEGTNFSTQDEQVAKVRDKLTEDAHKEKLKKEIRKKQDETDLLKKDEPKVEGIDEDLTKPVGAKPSAVKPEAPKPIPPGPIVPVK